MLVLLRAPPLYQPSAQPRRSAAHARLNPSYQCADYAGRIVEPRADVRLKRHVRNPLRELSRVDPFLRLSNCQAKQRRETKPQAALRP